MAEQCLLESCRTVKLNAVGEITRSIDGGIPIAGSPTAHGIIVLKGETNWIHKLMTTRTGRVRSMLRHPFPHCKNFAIRSVILQRRHIRRWWRGRRAEDIAQNPFAAKHGRGAIRIRRYGQNASLAKQAAPNAVFTERHAPEIAAVHVRNSVVLGEPLVQKRIICAQQVEYTAVLA